MTEAVADARPTDREVLDAARSFDRDRYLAALLAPNEARADLVVLAAYLGEIKRVPLLAREAAIGEIRLQWWRDALSSEGASGHPVADAMREVARRRLIDPGLLILPIEGYGRELYEDGVEDAHALEHYVDETEGASIRLALAILGIEPVNPYGRCGENAARALALTRLALTLPQHLAHGRLPVPGELVSRVRDPRGAGLDEARSAVRTLTAELARDAREAVALVRADGRELDAGFLDAVLPVALVEPYLSAALKPGRDVLASVADISPLSRVVRLWFAHWRRRV
jgi:15-cis-phytoene synthase